MTKGWARENIYLEEKVKHEEKVKSIGMGSGPHAAQKELPHHNNQHQKSLQQIQGQKQ